MKKCLFALIITIITVATGLSQSCSTYYPFEEGTTFQITSYGKKGNVVTIADYEVSDVSSTTATYNTSLKDEKGEVLTNGSFSVECVGDGISIDIESLLSPQISEQFKDFETEISGTNIILPNSLSVGQELPDAIMDMKINMSGMNMNMSVEMTDRKVIAKENITTPAGTFDCYVISYSSNVKMGMNQRGSAKQWIAKGVGMVKQEDYNKKGKVTSSSLLTAFSE